MITSIYFSSFNGLIFCPPIPEVTHGHKQFLEPFAKRWSAETETVCLNAFCVGFFFYCKDKCNHWDKQALTKVLFVCFSKWLQNYFSNPQSIKRPAWSLWKPLTTCGNWAFYLVAKAGLRCALNINHIIGFQRFICKNVKCLINQILCWGNTEIIVWKYWLNIVLKLISPVSFYFKWVIENLKIHM